MEYKEFIFEIKEIDDKGVFIGYASTFNNVDLGKDKILPGAFAKTLKKSKGIIPILADHSIRDQIGWNLEAEEDGKGLKVKGKLDFNVQKAVEKHSLAKMAKEVGAKMGLSIGYSTRKHDWDGDVRLLKELELYEYSFTAIPMNPKATVTSVKEARPCSKRDRGFCACKNLNIETSKSCSLSDKGFCADKEGKVKEEDDTIYLDTKLDIKEIFKTIREDMTVKEFETALRDAEVSKSKAKAIASILFNESRCDADQFKELMETINKVKDGFEN